MQHVHRGGVALLDLDGEDVQAILVVVDIDEDLGRLADRSRGVKRVVVAQDDEVGDSPEIVDVGAGEKKEVSQHPVAVPVHGQVRETVEDVEDPLAVGGDDAVHLCGEGFEARVGVKVVGDGSGAGVDQGFVIGESQIDHFAAFPHRPVHERRNEPAKMADAIDLPNDVVAGPQTVDRCVQARQSCAQLSGHRNTSRLDPIMKISKIDDL